MRDVRAVPPRPLAGEGWGEGRLVAAFRCVGFLDEALDQERPHPTLSRERERGRITSGRGEQSLAARERYRVGAGADRR